MIQTRSSFLCLCAYSFFVGETPFIQKLLLTQFRSYAHLDVAFDGRPVVLFGENGAGKTNLLEAISLLSPGRGLRRAKLADIARRTTQQDPLDAPAHNPSVHWAIATELNHNDTLIKVGTGQIPTAPTRRQIRIDGSNASGTDLAKQLTLNWLTPAHDRLFTGPPSDRRKFLDRLCLVHTPEHGRTSLAYEKSRSERGRLLSDGIDDDYWFDALENDLAERGAKIAKARFETLVKLKDEIATRKETAFPRAILNLDGEAENLFADGADERDVYEFIKFTLNADRPLDKRAGRTLRGVHKTDLQTTHLEKQMPAADCSTGEQKALLIGLILAHARSQGEHKPILLLDEVAAHLDEYRRAALIEELLELDTQVFMTGTDDHLFSAFAGRAQIFKVVNGQLDLQT